MNRVFWSHQVSHLNLYYFFDQCVFNWLRGQDEFGMSQREISVSLLQDRSEHDSFFCNPKVSTGTNVKLKTSRSH